MREYIDDEYTTQNNESCKNCRFYLPIVYEVDLVGSEDWGITDCGQCRRYPPLAKEEVEAIFPVVHEDSWCGEFDL